MGASKKKLKRAARLTKRTNGKRAARRAAVKRVAAKRRKSTAAKRGRTRLPLAQPANSEVPSVIGLPIPLASFTI